MIGSRRDGKERKHTSSSVSVRMMLVGGLIIHERRD